MIANIKPPIAQHTAAITVTSSPKATLNTIKLEKVKYYGNSKSKQKTISARYK